MSGHPNFEEEPQLEQPLMEHLLELRSRLLKIIIGVLVLFIPLAVFADTLFNLLALPMLRYLPQGSSMIATHVTSPFLTPFKFALLLAVILAVPWILYQIWAFVAPGLYKRERRLVIPLLASSTFLFYLGMSFAYLVVFPLIFRFMVKVAPTGVAVMTDITYYLDFVMTMFLAFGTAFELPVAIVLMVWAGFVTPDQLAGKRAYVLIGCFVVGMLLTPPDMLSQTMLALPCYVLYEVGIWFSRRIAKRKDDESASEADE